MGAGNFPHVGTLNSNPRLAERNNGERAMRKTSTKKAKPAPVTAWDFYLSNGDWFARLTFDSAAQVRKLFKKCKISGDKVYLA